MHTWPCISLLLFGYVPLFATPWTAACQASLSITNCQSLLKLHWVAIQPSHPLSSLLLLPQSFPASGSFPVSQLFASGGQSIGVSASALVLPMNIQDWFPLGLTSLISLQSKGLSRVFSSTKVRRHQFSGIQPFFISQLFHPYMTTGKKIYIYNLDSMDLCIQCNVSAF